MRRSQQAHREWLLHARSAGAAAAPGAQPRPDRWSGIGKISGFVRTSIIGKKLVVSNLIDDLGRPNLRHHGIAVILGEQGLGQIADLLSLLSLHPDRYRDQSGLCPEVAETGLALS